MRKWKEKRALGGESKWEFEIGEPDAPVRSSMGTMCGAGRALTR